MSQFLRDESLRNLTLSEEALRKINENILEIAKQVNDAFPREVNDVSLNKKLLMPSYIIRFDNKGFRLFDFQAAIKYFNDAHKIERFIFYLDSLESIESNKMLGKSIELKFAPNEPHNSNLVIQDDDNNWVDATFWKLKERLNKYQNKNYLIRNRWIPFFVQILGVVAGFIGSLWLAIKISPKLTIENSVAFTFIIAFLLFSNIWGFVFERIIKSINYFWPNISFQEKKGIHWLIRALISTALVSIFLYLLSRIFAYVGIIFKSIIK